MASAREKFNKPGGVPSLFSHTIQDTQKLGQQRFPSKKKYIKDDIRISQGIESNDSGLEGFGDVINKVKKEDVQVPAGAIRKHRMMKQISGRFNTETKKKGFDIFALIDGAIDNEPTEEAKEKARERAAAKKAAEAAPIPPKIVRKKAKSTQPARRSFVDQSTEKEVTSKVTSGSVEGQIQEVSTAANQAAIDGPVMNSSTTEKVTGEKETARIPRASTAADRALMGTPAMDSFTTEKVAAKSEPASMPGASTATNQVSKDAPAMDSFTTEKVTAKLEPASITGASTATNQASKDAPAMDSFTTETVATKIKAASIPGASTATNQVSKGAPGMDSSTTEKVTAKLKPTSVTGASTATNQASRGAPGMDSSTTETVATKIDAASIPGASTATSQASISVPAMFSSATEQNTTKKEPAWKLRLQGRQITTAKALQDEERSTSHGGKIGRQSNSDQLIEAPDTGSRNVKIMARDDAPKEVNNDAVSTSSTVASATGNVASNREPAWKLRFQERQAASAKMQPVEEPIQDVATATTDSVEDDKIAGQFDQQTTPSEAVRGEDDFSVSISSAESEQSAKTDHVDTEGTSEIVTATPLDSQERNSNSAFNDIKHDEKREAIKDSMEETILSSVRAPEPLKVTPPNETHFAKSRIEMSKRHDVSDSDTSDSSSEEDTTISIAPNAALLPKLSSTGELKTLAMAPTFALEAKFSEASSAENDNTQKGPAICTWKSIGTESSSEKASWLREQIKEIEKKLKTSTVDTKLEFAALRNTFEKESEMINDVFDEKIRAQRKLNERQDKEHEKVINEEKKIVENLRAENKVLRASVDRIPKQIAETKHSIASLEDANADIAKHLEDLGRFSRKLEADHERLVESSRQCRDEYLPRYRRELRERQMILDVERKIKNLYRDCTIKVAKHVGDVSRRPDLIEIINELVLETEASVNPKFDPRVLVASDSDSSSTSDSDSSSDSDSD